MSKAFRDAGMSQSHINLRKPSSHAMLKHIARSNTMRSAQEDFWLAKSMIWASLYAISTLPALTTFTGFRGYMGRLDLKMIQKVGQLTGNLLIKPGYAPN